MIKLPHNTRLEDSLISSTDKVKYTISKHKCTEALNVCLVVVGVCMSVVVIMCLFRYQNVIWSYQVCSQFQMS